MSSLRAARSPSWRWATRSRPGQKPEHDSQNDPQNGEPGLTRKTEKAQWDQLAVGPGVEALLAEHESANGMARPCSRPARRKVLRGIKKHKEHVPCHTSPHHLPSARSASISVRIASILSVSINAGRLFGNSNARALNLSAGSPTFRALIGMEACCGAHYIARQLAALGHDVRLLPAQYVKPFLKGHKNDYRDAEAIAEAVQRPTMHFVAIKTPEQMDLLALHRVRSRLVGQRTGVINQIRGFLIERGITVRQGVAPLRRALPDILSANTGALSPRMVNLISELVQDWRRLDERFAAVSAEIESLAEQDQACQRVMTVPGVGPIISSAVVAAIGNGAGFTQGRDFGAWLGLVPKQESTGDRTILGKISKRGNKYLRTLFVQAAHVVLARRPNAAMRSLWPWIEQASRRLHRNMLAIALANKLARIAWAVLARGRPYQPRIVAI